MIPLSLRLSGFLSYQAPVELEFTNFDLACISGQNGAGKSSLLDAMTWALFGQARKRDEAVINSQCEAAEVIFTFLYERNKFRVQRSLRHGKNTILEFQLWQENGDGSGWKALTGNSVRETQKRIEETLRLDYETFVNVAFFLQGKADQFTQQRPGDRKRILSSILGLDSWEIYRQRAMDRRKIVDAGIARIEGRLAEIQSELAEEEERKAYLGRLESELEGMTRLRISQESTVDSFRKIAATLAEQGRLVEALARQYQAARRRLNDLEQRLEGRRRERDGFAQKVANAEQIRANYAAWQATRAELERWDEVAARFREQEKRRQEPLNEINNARTHLTVELQGLECDRKEAEKDQQEIVELEKQRTKASQELEKAEAQLAERKLRDQELQAARQVQAEIRAEKPRLKAEMDELKERIDELSKVEGANCPLCGQPLSQEDREKLLADLQAEGKMLGDRYRANKTLLEQSDQQVTALEKAISVLSQAEASLRVHHQAFAQAESRIGLLKGRLDDWLQNGALHYQELVEAIRQESYAAEARQRLAVIDAELKAIGYDAATHDGVRRLEASLRSSDAELRDLERAQAALEPIERELADLETQALAQRSEVEREQMEHDQAAASLAAAQAQAPDLYAAERELDFVREKENRLRADVGAARQRVTVLETLKANRKSLEAQQEEQMKLASQYKQLEKAFSKDGVPALLIEQALPQIEAKANEILDRLSGGTMSVRFATQAAYKDKTRDDLKETLDILISDGMGTRDYELYSGGEAFRVNFAIRLALSEVLAKRAGARLQTLVIDEGFGSQDNLGRQRLIEAINLVAHDFAKILVITHIDELKDAFPARIEVEKTLEGSMVKIV